MLRTSAVCSPPGTSVITTTSYNHLPTYGADIEAAFVDACRPGQSRFHAAGENPGFMFERLVTTVTGLSKTIDRIDLYEATDVSAVDSRPMLVDLMGMGRPPEDVSVDSPIIKKLDMAYRQTLNATADVLGITLSNIEVSVEATTLPHDIEVKVGTIEAGTVVGQRFSWVGHWSDRPLARHPRGMGAHPRPPAMGHASRWPPARRRHSSAP